jgi:hypothetical protein
VSFKIIKDIVRWSSLDRFMAEIPAGIDMQDQWTAAIDEILFHYIRADIDSIGKTVTDYRATVVLRPPFTEPRELQLPHTHPFREFVYIVPLLCYMNAHNGGTAVRNGEHMEIPHVPLGCALRMTGDHEHQVTTNRSTRTRWAVVFFVNTKDKIAE